MLHKNEYWRLQKAANLSNTQAAEYLGVNISSIKRWRNGSTEAPKSVILALTALVEKQNEN